MHYSITGSAFVSVTYKPFSFSFPLPPENGSTSPVLAFALSPRPNHTYVFKREPPEGCEKIRAFEEAA